MDNVAFQGAATLWLITLLFEVLGSRLNFCARLSFSDPLGWSDAPHPFDRHWLLGTAFFPRNLARRLDLIHSQPLNFSTYKKQ